MKSIALIKSNIQFKGGLEKYTCQLIEAFSQKGYTVHLLTTNAPPFSLNASVHALCSSSKFSLLHLLRFEKACQNWLKKNPQTHVFSLERTPLATHFRAGLGVHKAYLERRKKTDPFWKSVSFRINPLHRFILKQEKKMLLSPKLKTIFVNSHMVQKEMISFYPETFSKICVVHNGVEWMEFAPYFEKSSFAKEKGPYRLLFIGNGYARKGLPELLHAIHRFPCHSFHLTVVGKEKQLSRYQALAKKLQIEKQVLFKGKQKEITPFYQNADALVIPSHYDPFANVTVEALSMGLFVISSKSNGGFEVLSKQNGAILEDLHNPLSWQRALEKALCHPKTKKQALSIRQSVKNLDFSHSLSKIIEKTLL